MRVRMLVSISQTNGVNARLGQELDLPDDKATELIANRQAEPLALEHASGDQADLTSFADSKTQRLGSKRRAEKDRS